MKFENSPTSDDDIVKVRYPSVFLEEMNFVVVPEVSEYCVDFTIYASCTPDPTDEIFAHGFVRADGCSNWHFDAQDQLMIHFCNREELEDIGKLLTFCFDYAADHLETWED